MRHTLKLQRWIDLVSALLARQHGATLVELVAHVPGYRGKSKSALRRTFERDKDELRRLGVPIATHGNDGDAETRYTLAPRQFYMPYLALVTPRGRRAAPRVDRYGYRALGECDFTDDDFALLADAAARVMAFGDPVLSADARNAMQRLAIDLPPDSIAPAPGITLQLATPQATAEHLTLLGDALTRRKQVRFTYYGIERDETERRTVLPYGLAFTSGHWYLHALDPSRGAVRRFRVSRMHQVEVNPRTAGSADYAIPTSFRLVDRASPVPAWQLGDDPGVTVEVRLARANGATRAARRLGTASPTNPALVCYTVRRREPFLRWLLGLAGDAVPVGPPDIVREYSALITRTLDVARVTPT
ncbi:MAG TPA: WYL domain-containing protein [Gemmatimonadales bacterium]|nr:WYL domain-containing protein [Gemmatimonadales bacterium]